MPPTHDPLGSGPLVSAFSGGKGSCHSDGARPSRPPLEPRGAHSLGPDPLPSRGAEEPPLRPHGRGRMEADLQGRGVPAGVTSGDSWLLGGSFPATSEAGHVPHPRTAAHC